jgi:hypothetical protein
MVKSARPLRAKLKIAVIDATVVNLAQSAPGLDEHRGFRRYAYVRHAYQGLFGVEHCIR